MNKEIIGEAKARRMKSSEHMALVLVFARRWHIFRRREEGKRCVQFLAKCENLIFLSEVSQILVSVYTGFEEQVEGMDGGRVLCLKRCRQSYCVSF